MKSAQDHKEWYRQELRYRREEIQISYRWFWPLLFAFQVFLLWSGMLHGIFWRFALPGLTAVLSAVMGAHAWVLWFQHHRARRSASGDQTEPPDA